MRAEITSKETVRVRHVILGIFPCVNITKQNRDANVAKRAYSGTLRLTVSPEKVEEKWWRRICYFIEEFEADGLRIPRYRTAEIPDRCYGRARNSGDLSAAVRFSSGKKGSIAGSDSEV